MCPVNTRTFRLATMSVVLMLLLTATRSAADLTNYTIGRPSQCRRGTGKAVPRIPQMGDDVLDVIVQHPATRRTGTCCETLLIHKLQGVGEAHYERLYA